MFTESYACCPATLKPLFGCCAAANYLMIFKKNLLEEMGFDDKIKPFQAATEALLQNLYKCYLFQVDNEISQELFR